MPQKTNPPVVWDNASEEFKKQATELLRQIVEEALKQMDLYWQEKRKMIEDDTLKSLAEFLKTLQASRGIKPSFMMPLAKVEDRESLDQDDTGIPNSRENVSKLIESVLVHFQIESTGTFINRSVNSQWLANAKIPDPENETTPEPD